MKKKKILVTLLVPLFWGCVVDAEPKTEKTSLFTQVDHATSKLRFANTIQENDSLNYYSFPYIYMGGGVAIADFNNDGLSDLYLTGNMVSNKLYLNKGDMVFEDITESSGTAGDDRWYTGITTVDINHDGYTDIYLSVSGKDGNTSNQLFINKGDLTFEERASEFGIDDQGHSIQSTFFDYDRDGDLDLFVANYPLIPISLGNAFYAEKIRKNDWKDSGHLYRNEGSTFVEVTAAAGVQNFGLTLGLSSADLNSDGWADLYLSNDFNVPDYFYLNNKDGTFSEVLQQAIGHTSMFGMGIDVADFNNDGLLDLIQADMTPEDYTRAKVNMASMAPDNFRKAVDLGFHYQYMQNSLQLNNGVNTIGIPIMTEMSRMANVATTDWSWSTVFADLDNDGWKDAYITNGMKRDVNDNDVNDRSDEVTFQKAFGRTLIEDYPSEPLHNYAYRNNGDLTFEKMTDAWGLSYKSFSNGMAYGDLDNDGDLDLVINNLDEPLSLFENSAAQTGNHYLRVKLQGFTQNTQGLGARLQAKIPGTDRIQTVELLTSRGFQSAVEPIAHFGLGSYEGKLELLVNWPNGQRQTLEVKEVNQTLELTYSPDEKASNVRVAQSILTFEDHTQRSGMDFVHQEDGYDDFRREPLLPHKYSTQGPGLACGDINADGLEDFFVGNAAGKSGELYIQHRGQTFTRVSGPWEQDGAKEDTGALFFDVDNDGDLDFYVVSGGHNPARAPEFFQDRLYLNTKGKFEKAVGVLPQMNTAGRVIAVSDYDKDGDLDVFVGGRNVPGSYPSPADSHLLKNQVSDTGELKFIDVTTTECPTFKSLGMVTTASWADINSDGWEDLLVAGEWMSPRLFINQKGRLVEQTEAWGLNEKTGWWYALSVFDVDNDGDKDIVLGNLGLNYKYKASSEKPFEVFAADFDGNDHTDIVLSQHKEGKLLPLRGRECSSQQIPAIKLKYPTYREFAAADLFDIYGKAQLENALHYSANTFAHYWLENKGDKGFTWHPLPKRSQLAPIQSIIPFDYDQDGHIDLLVSGNLYDAEVETPRADGGVGLVLKNDGKKGFIVIPPSKSNLMLSGNIQFSSKIRLGEERGFLFAGSNTPLTLKLLKKG